MGNRGGTTYMTQIEAAEHVAERLSLLQRRRAREGIGDRRGEKRRRKMQRDREKRLAQLQGMPPIVESTEQQEQQEQQQQQQQQQYAAHVLQQQYICFVRHHEDHSYRAMRITADQGPALGAPILMSACPYVLRSSDEGRLWVFCDAFGNANDGRAPGKHVNLEELSTRALARHHQGVRSERVIRRVLPMLATSSWRTEDHATSGASFTTQEWTANVDLDDDAASEAASWAPSDASYFTARWLPHDLV